MRRDFATHIALSYLGTFYSWGGDDPSGFDCSGLVIEILKSVGCLPREGDWTAHQLAVVFSDVAVDAPDEGCLVFWWDAAGKKIVHVEYCLNAYLAIGASGGGSKTRTMADAIKHNAFVKIRPIASRAGKRTYCNPFQQPMEDTT